MWTAEIIRGIIGGILAIVGILLAISGGNLWGRKPKWSIALGLALSGVGLFVLLTSFPEYAIGFSVLATLALAIAAFLTIKVADAREECRREEELEREKRDRKVQLLNDIINWAEDLASCSFLEKTRVKHSAGNLLQRHRYFASRETYIRKGVLFFENEGLSNALSRILDIKGSLRNVIGGLSALDTIDVEIEGKEALIKVETEIKVETDNVKLANLSLEIGKLHTSAALKWIDLVLIDKKLYEDVADLIEHASNIKIKLISEF